jgi:hypothetical protein
MVSLKEQCGPLLAGLAVINRSLRTAFGPSSRDRLPYLLDSLASIVEVHLVLLDADEALLCKECGDACRAAAHEWVENTLRTDRIADIPHLRQRPWAGHGIARSKPVPFAHVRGDPIEWQLIL